MPTLINTQPVNPPSGPEWYRYIKVFFDKQTVKGPAGKVLIMGPRRDGKTYPENHSDYYINKNLTAIQYPSGPQNSGPALPENRACFSARFWFGNRQFSTYNNTYTDTVVGNYLGQENAKYHTFDTKEVYDGTGWYYDANPAQYERAWKKMGEFMEARGQICGGDYDGPFLMDFKVDRGDLDYIAALNSPAEALAFMQSDPYFFLRLYEHGCHPVVNMYFRGAADFRYRNLQYEMQLSVAKLSMQATGSNKKLISYTQNIVNEFTPVGQAIKQRLDLDAGGELTWIGNYTIDLNEMLWWSFRASLTCDIVWDFTDPQIHGTSQATLLPEETNGDGVVTRHFDPKGSGNNPDRTRARGFYNQEPTDAIGKNGGPFPGDVEGFGDAIPIGFNIAGEVTDHVGTSDYVYPGVIVNGTTYTPGPGYSFCRVAYANKLPTCVGYLNQSTGKGWAAWIDHGTKFGRDVVFTFGGVQVPVFTFPGQPQWIKFTSTL